MHLFVSLNSSTSWNWKASLDAMPTVLASAMIHKGTNKTPSRCIWWPETASPSRNRFQEIVSFLPQRHRQAHAPQGSMTSRNQKRFQAPCRANGNRPVGYDDEEEEDEDECATDLSWWVSGRALGGLRKYSMETEPQEPNPTCSRFGSSKTSIHYLGLHTSICFMSLNTVFY